MKTILIIEDDPSIRQGLSETFEAEHFTVLAAANGEKGYQAARHEHIDLIVLDLMLPDKNGEEICRDLRRDGFNTPILMLTSKTDEVDKIMGLESGADDYVTKPFSIRELLARVKALLRRRWDLRKELEEYAFGPIRIDFKKAEAHNGSTAIRLSVRELEVLKFFILHEGEVVTRDMLLNEVWGYDSFPTTRTIDNYVLSLRKKIEENAAEPRHLVTVHTAGYKFVK
jgi:DNA-binding response OmpR family regulator